MSINCKFLKGLVTLVVSVLCACADTESNESWTENESIRAERMQEFVEEISAYTHKKNPNFVIVPQNGAELAFNNTDPKDGFRNAYINAIDGIGIEELFYDRTLKPDNERLQMLRAIKSRYPSITIVVSDIVLDEFAQVEHARLCADEAFLAFRRSSDNEDYHEIPPIAFGLTKNSNNINNLNNAENYLYLISDTKYNDKKLMLADISATDYDIVLMDLFFKDKAFTKKDIESLKQKSCGGTRLLLAYVSIGSAEKYRYYWKDEWKKGNPSWIKKSYSGYPDEYWVEYWNNEWKKIIFDYIDKIIAAGFDGVYLDNVEAYYFVAQ